MWWKWVNYLSLMIFALVGLLFYHHYVVAVLLLFMTVLPVFSYILMRKSVKKIKITVNADKTSIGKRNPVDVCFDVENDSILPMEEIVLTVRVYNHFYQNQEEYAVVIPALPKKTKQTKMTIEGVYCGRMVVRVEKAVIYDPLGLFRFKRELEESAEIFIMPTKTCEFDKVPLSTLGSAQDEEIQMKKGDDVSQVSEIRNYVPGDKLQNIHWKLSAKNDELQVKEFSLPYSEDVVLLVELFYEKESPQVFDALIEMLYAFSRYLLVQGRKFSLVWKEQEYSLKEMEIYHEDDLNTGIREIFFAELSEVNGAAYRLYTSIHPELRGTVLYLSTGRVSVQGGLNLDVGSEEVVLTCLN